MLIPDQYLDALRSTGLLVSEPFVPDHLGFPDGVVVAKPEALAGNSLEHYECIWGPDGTILDAPCLYFHRDGRHWIVTCHEYIPGPGPGDFVDTWETAEEAVADIIDFFLGDPSRMDQKRQARAVEFDDGPPGSPEPE